MVSWVTIVTLGFESMVVAPEAAVWTLGMVAALKVPSRGSDPDAPGAIAAAAADADLNGVIWRCDDARLPVSKAAMNASLSVLCMDADVLLSSAAVPAEEREGVRRDARDDTTPEGSR